MPKDLKDVKKCIELDPTFPKGYTRKGAIQFFMKEYDRTRETYQEGLKHDQNNHEFMDGVRRCVAQINKTNRGDINAGYFKEKQAKAMQDPAIHNILSDPVMKHICKTISSSSNFTEVFHHLQDLYLTCYMITKYLYIFTSSLLT